MPHAARVQFDPPVGSLRSLPSPLLTILGNHRRRALLTREEYCPALDQVQTGCWRCFGFRRSEPAPLHRTGDRQSSPGCGSMTKCAVVPDHRGKIRATRLASASRLPMRRRPPISLRSRSGRISIFVSSRRGRPFLTPKQPLRVAHGTGGVGWTAALRRRPGPAAGLRRFRPFAAPLLNHSSRPLEAVRQLSP